MNRRQRGVLYIVWGEQHQAWVQRSIHSLRALHPDLPVHIHTLPAEASFPDKALMFDASPFEETLYLDADTQVLDRLDFGFERAVQFGLACCICECPWARRYRELSGDLVEYNTGVVFFTRVAQPVFDAWKVWSARLDSHIQYRGLSGAVDVMPLNDQAGFAKAIAETGCNPFVLPLNWNFRPIWYHTYSGPIKIWHDYSDVPEIVIEKNAGQTGEQKLLNFYKLK